MKLCRILWLLGLTLITACATEDRPRVVFVIGDEEYRSEESMPMLAQLLDRELDADIVLCYSQDKDGYIDPNKLDSIPGLKALKQADLMVMFTRFRALPDSQLQHILNYTGAGKPVVGFRTSTHAFLYQDPDYEVYNHTWPTQLFGQQWITHHGHFDDGKSPLTEVHVPRDQSHPILNGVEDFSAYSWLYHVDGGDWQLYGDSSPLLFGTSLKSNHEANGNLEKFPLTNPVAWTKTYSYDDGPAGRVFFTTLGHPYDFREPAMRKLALNGIFWALGLENRIPVAGISAQLDAPYEPNNSGFGQKFKPNRRPLQITN